LQAKAVIAKEGVVAERDRRFLSVRRPPARLRLADRDGRESGLRALLVEFLDEFVDSAF
jgi:hypothetical protein